MRDEMVWRTMCYLRIHALLPSLVRQAGLCLHHFRDSLSPKQGSLVTMHSMSVQSMQSNAYCVLGTQKVKRSRTDPIPDLKNLTV